MSAIVRNPPIDLDRNLSASNIESGPGDEASRRTREASSLQEYHSVMLAISGRMEKGARSPHRICVSPLNTDFRRLSSLTDAASGPSPKEVFHHFVHFFQRLRLNPLRPFLN